MSNKKLFIMIKLAGFFLQKLAHLAWEVPNSHERFFLYIHKNNPLDQEALNVLARKINFFPLAHASMCSEDHLQLVSTVHKSDCLRIFKEPTRNLTFFLQGNIFESIKGIKKIDESSEEYALKNQLIKLSLEKGLSARVGFKGIYNLIVWNHKLHSLEMAGDRQR